MSCKPVHTQTLHAYKDFIICQITQTSISLFFPLALQNSWNIKIIMNISLRGNALHIKLRVKGSIL